MLRGNEIKCGKAFLLLLFSVWVDGMYHDCLLTLSKPKHVSLHTTIKAYATRAIKLLIGYTAYIHIFLKLNVKFCKGKSNPVKAG